MTAPPTLDRNDLVRLGSVFAVAATLRIVWVLWVQPPEEAVFSDMRSYLHQAMVVLGYRKAEGPATMVLFPWGVHSWYAALLYLFGPPDWGYTLGRTGWTGGSLTPVAIAHAVTNALVAPLTFLAALEITHRRNTALVAGLIIALWPPLLVFSGFFTSETPFAVGVAASTWLLARSARTGSGGWAAGLALAVGSLMRPPMLLTAGLSVVWMALRSLRKPALVRATAGMAIVLVLIVGFSAARFHAYTGRMGLISANGELARLFAVSDYRRVVNPQGKGFRPPARSEALGFVGEFEFNGDWLQDEQFTSERTRIWSGMGWGQRAGVLGRNVSLLVAQNSLWPERAAVLYAKDAGVANPERHQWRVDLVPVHEVLAWILVPLALLGLARSVGRDSPGMQVVGMQLFTLVFAAAFYFGETRYRVPYDAVLVVAAACAFTPPPAPASPPDRRLLGVVAVALLLVLGFIV